MKVRRIVSNVATADVDKAGAFYEEILGLEVLMDLGWIRTYGSGSKMTVQVSVMSEGGSRVRKAGIAIESARRPSDGECAGSTCAIHSES